MQAAIFNGLYGNQNASAAAYNCPTGNCMWPTFSSLGFCSKCSNVTAETSIVDTYNTSDTIDNIWGLPTLGNLTLRTFWTNGTLAWYSTVIQSSVIQLNQWNLSYNNAIAGFGIIFFSLPANPWIASSNINAFECQLYYCIRTYNATSTNGVTNSIQISSWPSNDTVAIQIPYDGPQTSNASVTSNNIVLKPFGSQRFEQYNQSYVVNINNSMTLSHTFNAMFTMTGVMLINGTGRTLEFNDAAFGDLAELFYSHADPTPIMDSLAISMTNQIRNLPGNNSQVLGTAWKTETYIHVRWW